jgi:tRNA(adenine34) deaminase
VNPSAPEDGSDRAWMAHALEAARAAGAHGEVPVGAAVVHDGRLVVAAGNASIAECDPTGHAEVRALRAAAVALGNHRLNGAALYATVEPCAMCMGAAIQARIALLVYGCADPKAGAAGSVMDLARHERLNHRFAVRSGIAAEEAAALLRAFFVPRRRS